MSFDLQFAIAHNLNRTNPLNEIGYNTNRKLRLQLVVMSENSGQLCSIFYVTLDGLSVSSFLLFCNHARPNCILWKVNNFSCKNECSRVIKSLGENKSLSSSENNFPT